MHLLESSQFDLHQRSFVSLGDPQLLVQRQDFDIFFPFGLPTEHEPIQHHGEDLSQHKPEHVFVDGKRKIRLSIGAVVAWLSDGVWEPVPAAPYALENTFRAENLAQLDFA